MYSPDGTEIVGITNSGQTSTGTYIFDSNGSGSSTLFRNDPESIDWTSLAVASAGTYPDPITDGAAPSDGGGGGGGSSSPTLPDTGGLSRSWPIALLVSGLALITAVEVGRRVRPQT